MLAAVASCAIAVALFCGTCNNFESSEVRQYKVVMNSDDDNDW